MNCAHCGRTAIGDELFCRACGLAFIPERPVALDVPRATGPGAATGVLPAPSVVAAPTAPASSTWAVLAHVTAVLGALSGGIAAFVGPLVVLLVRGDDPFAAEHARESLNFNLSVIAYAIVGAVAGAILTLVTFGAALLALVPLVVVAVVAYFVTSVVAAVAAAQGRPFHYPLALPLVRAR